MVRPMYDYTALHRIPANGPVAYYQRGDDVQASVVEQLGLVVGEDVIPARPDVVPRPADDAPRSEWVAYALGQGKTRAEVDDMNADEFAAEFPPDAKRTDFVRLEDWPDPTAPVDDSEVTAQGVRIPRETAAPTEDAAKAVGVNAINVPDDDPAEGEPEPEDDGLPSPRPVTKAEWVDWAVSEGADRETAEGLTIAQLRTRGW